MHEIIAKQSKTILPVSMIDGRLFDKLECLGRRIRENGQPFGGIQLILSGDFFQLPPVPEKTSIGQKIPPQFTFEAESWNECITRMIVLRQVFRQTESGRTDDRKLKL